MSVYICKKCGTHEHIRFAVELIPENEDVPDDVWAVQVNAVCSGCGDWISVDVTSAMVDFFEYFGPNRDEGTLMLDEYASAPRGDADCLDAETIQRQQERIAELERELESLQVVGWWTDEYGDTHAIAANGQEVCHYVRGEHAEAVNRALAERDALIRDMWPLVLSDGTSEAFAERMRELGIEVRS